MKHSKKISILSGLASLAGFASVVLRFVPPKYAAIANALAGLLVAVSAMHASDSGPAAPPAE